MKEKREKEKEDSAQIEIEKQWLQQLQPFIKYLDVDGLHDVDQSAIAQQSPDQVEVVWPRKRAQGKPRSHVSKWDRNTNSHHQRGQHKHRYCSTTLNERNFSVAK